MPWHLRNHIRVLLTLLGAFLLGLGASVWLHRGVPSLLRLGVLALAVFLMFSATGWLIRWLVVPHTTPGEVPVSLEDMPRLWAELERENLSLRELKEAEDALRKGILARLQEGVVLLGRDGSVKLYNPAAETLLGRGSPLVKGATFASLFREPEAQRQLAIAQGGEPVEWTLVRGHRTLRLRGIPFQLDHGGSLLLTLDDVTRQEVLESTRQRFVSNLSHELKTPLTSLRIAVENLQAEQTQSGPADPNLASLLRAVDRMTLLLEDISELSRIESGALRLSPSSLVVTEFMQDLVAEFRPMAEGKPVELHTVLAIPPETRLQADALRLHQLIGNLLSNAIKFSPPGSSVSLRLAVEPRHLRWEVQDQGPGIALADQPKVFERFFRAASARGVPGTGLGLAIVKHLARLMGGEVGFTSEVGKGTVFWVELPAGESGDRSLEP